MEQAREQVIDRIRKLLALATSPNENEAAAAAAKAHEMLEEHNIAMFEIEDVHAPSPVIEDRSTTHSTATWFRVVLMAVAKNNYCSVSQRRIRASERSYNRNYILIGRPENVEATKIIAAWLERRLSKLARESWGHEIPLSRHCTAFLTGAAFAVSARLRAERGDIPAESTALVVRLDLENDAYKAEAYPVLGVARTRGAYLDPSSYAAGHRAGDTVPLRPVHEVAAGGRGLVRAHAG